MRWIFGSRTAGEEQGAVARRLEDAHARLSALETDVLHYREALDAAPVGVVIRDATGREVFRNRLGGSPTGELHADVLVARALDTLLSKPPATGVVRETLDLLGPPARSVELTALAMSSGGVVGIVEDVSERHRLDSVRRDFVANVNHELRTPVGAIGLLAETLEAEPDPDVARRLIGRISAEVARAQELIEDLLDLSRIETLDRPAHEPVHVREVVTRAVERAHVAEERAGVTIQVDGFPDATVYGIRDDLVSALANLLDNAVKYSERGATVHLAVRSSGRDVEFVVRDQGIGIAPKELDRIFERFYRVDRARDRRTGGSGLGLAIVRHVATNHGGEVLVESVEGHGSTFTLRVAADGPTRDAPRPT